MHGTGVCGGIYYEGIYMVKVILTVRDLRGLRYIGAGLQYIGAPKFYFQDSGKE